jgi:hypothetical protein
VGVGLRSATRRKRRIWVPVGASSHSSNRPVLLGVQGSQGNGTERNGMKSDVVATGGSWTDTFALGPVRPAAAGRPAGLPLVLAVEKPFLFSFSCGGGGCVPEQCGMGESRANIYGLLFCFSFLREKRGRGFVSGISKWYTMHKASSSSVSETCLVPFLFFLAGTHAYPLVRVGHDVRGVMLRVFLSSPTLCVCDVTKW